ncbi:MAG: molybdenum cofactor guanylyltransferase [Desulfomonile sp.]|nr:molybdenum cofactor guanylyltransferase [Desulfomonile sp.]
MNPYADERIEPVYAPNIPAITGIVLAGGESRRMGGVNKALLRIAGLTMIERVVTALQQVFPEIIVVTNHPEDFRFLNLPMFPDIRSGCGSLGGLYTGLKRCRGDFGFLVGCDMPFLDPAPIRFMTERVNDHDVVIPRIGEHLEPLHAIYSIRCIPHIEGLLDRGDLKIIDILDQVDVFEISETDLRCFDENLRFVVNLNTRAELEEARRVFRDSPIT